MYGHPSHLNPYGYRRQPGKVRRAVVGALKLSAFFAAAVVVVIPWWAGVAALWGAFL